jgi:hypothetical protein
MTEGVPHLLNVTFSKLPDKSKFENQIKDIAVQNKNKRAVFKARFYITIKKVI